jgi:pimeloyl-ACP methyl ester carboxylesterase
MDTLAPRFHVLAPDLCGAGRSPPCPEDRRLTLRDEIARLEPAFGRAGDPFTLVGHSYGGAVALIAAVAAPTRIRALVVYEPTLFSLVDAQSPPPNDADGIRAVVTEAGAALDAGNTARAAECFIDFWMSPGSWSRMPDSRKAPIMASIVNLRGWGHALMCDATPLEAFARLEIPVLYIIGSRSPAASRAVARVLTRTLPQVDVVELEGVGHMGPVTHAAVVNEVISGWAPL